MNITQLKNHVDGITSGINYDFEGSLFIVHKDINRRFPIPEERKTAHWYADEDRYDQLGVDERLTYDRINFVVTLPNDMNHIIALTTFDLALGRRVISRRSTENAERATEYTSSTFPRFYEIEGNNLILFPNLSNRALQIQDLRLQYQADLGSPFNEDGTVNMDYTNVILQESTDLYVYNLCHKAYLHEDNTEKANYYLNLLDLERRKYETMMAERWNTAVTDNSLPEEDTLNDQTQPGFYNF